MMRVMLVRHLEVQLVADYNLGDDADPLQKLKGAVHGGQVNIGVLDLDQAPNFVGADMPWLAGNDVQHRQALRRHPVTLLPQ